MLDWVTEPQAWAALVTLTLLEIVLGIDNLVFISIQVDRLPAERQPAARKLGLLLAMGTRVALLLSLAWLMGLTKPWFEIFGQGISGRDLILLVGGLFLLGKSTVEIHDNVEGHGGQEGGGASRAAAGFAATVIQIGLLDIVFSLDSVITAIGMADHVVVMVIAIVLAIGVMMVMVDAISRFIQRHPTVKMLALSFLLLIGMALVGEGLGFHVPKGYIYFAMAFSAGVEMLNLRAKAKTPSQSGES